LVVACVACVACGEPATSSPVVAPTAKSGTAPSARPPAFDEAAWGKFHSKRFQLTLPLPEGRAWRIDDHAKRELVATHPPTSSKLTVYSWYDNELMSHAKCEAKARGEGLVPKTELRTIESEVTVGPEAYDTRIWVAADARPQNGPLVGHLFMFGAFIRRCLFVHLETEVPSREDEDVLSSRLAVARVRLLGGLKLDPPRTMEDSDVPREKPSNAP
jgi:hypothetical protein